MLRGVLFDLDDTLFDHHHATRLAVASLWETEPAFLTWGPEELRRRHGEMLEIIHREVVAGRLAIDEARRERFARLLMDAGAEPAALARASALATQYRAQYERGWRPVEGALDVLATLRAQGLAISVVTNNLTAEQVMKMSRCALDQYVDALVTSEDVGAAKPDPAIFTAALDRLGLAAADVVMVGDAWDTDIVGALAAGVRPVWFNWRGLPARDATVTEIAALTPTADALAAILGPKA